jgi:hypothetical protein
LYTAKANGRNQVRLFGQSCRSHRRVDASLDGRFRVLPKEYHPLTTLKLSEGGLLFVADRVVPNGSLVEVDLKLPQCDQEIAVCGRVVHGKQTESGRYEAAVSLEGFNTEDRRLLATYVRQVSLQAVPVASA